MLITAVNCAELPRQPRPRLRDGLRTARAATGSPKATPAPRLRCTSPADVTGCTPCHDPSLTIEHNTAAARRPPAAPSSATPATPAPTRSWSPRSPRGTRRARRATPSRPRRGCTAPRSPTPPWAPPGITCGQCHQTDVQTEHAKPTSSSFALGCAACHPSPRDTLTPAWDKTCTQAGCHATGTPTRSTAAHGGPRAASRQRELLAAGCHKGTDLSVLHAQRRDDRRRRRPPLVPGLPCGRHPAEPRLHHVPHRKPASQLDAAHTANPASQTVTISGQSFGPVACADCHASPLLTTIHTGSCATCHPAPKDTLTPAVGQVLRPGWLPHAGSTAPMHGSIDASHAPVAGQTCYVAGCHAATGIQSLAETHRNASAVLGGSHARAARSATGTARPPAASARAVTPIALTVFTAPPRPTRSPRVRRCRFR